MIAGRLAWASRSAAASIAAGCGAGASSGGSGGREGCVDRGRLGLDVDREHQHHRPALDHRALVGALGVVGGGLAGCARARRSRRRTRPGRAGRSGSSRSAPPPASRPASTSSGVRLLAASVSPVIVLVRPGPWCTLHTPTPAGHPRVPVGHADRAALVAGVVEAGAAANERVGDDEVAAAEDPERVPDALRRDRRSDDVGHRGGLGGLRGGQPHRSESLTGRRSYMPSGRDVSFRMPWAGSLNRVSPATRPAANMLPGRQGRRLRRRARADARHRHGRSRRDRRRNRRDHGSSGSQGWLIGLVVACVSVVLSAVLWSSRQV